MNKLETLRKNSRFKLYALIFSLSIIVVTMIGLQFMYLENYSFSIISNNNDNNITYKGTSFLDIRGNLAIYENQKEVYSYNIDQLNANISNIESNIAFLKDLTNITEIINRAGININIQFNNNEPYIYINYYKLTINDTSDKYTVDKISFINKQITNPKYIALNKDSFKKEAKDKYDEFNLNNYNSNVYSPFYRNNIIKNLSSETLNQINKILSKQKTVLLEYNENFLKEMNDKIREFENKKDNLYNAPKI